MSDSVKILTVKKTPGRKSGGSKKIGRNVLKCSRYRSAGKHEKNKVKRFKKMLKQTKQFSLLKRLMGIKDWETIKARAA